MALTTPGDVPGRRSFAPVPVWPFVIAAVLAFVALVTLVAVTVDHDAGPRGAVRGSGVAATEHREVAPFTGLALAGSNTVTVHVGAPRSVTVTADDNLLDRVTTTVQDGRLVIDTHGSFTTRTKMRVAVSVPSLEEVTLRGAGTITVDGVTGRAFGAELSGAGTVTVSGAVDRVTARLSGTGTLDVRRLAADDATARLDGTGQVRVRAASTLDATLNGTGSIIYSGSPLVTAHQTGTGSIAPE